MNRLHHLALASLVVVSAFATGCGAGGGMEEPTAPNVAPGTPSDVDFLHVANGGNIIGHATEIQHALLNGNPNAILLITQVWNPPGLAGTYNNHAIGVWYHPIAQRWRIYNEDIAAMPTGASFNVRIVNTDPDAFHWIANPGNTIGNRTIISDPAYDGDASLIMLATHNYNPPGGGAVYNDHAMGIYFNGVGQWSIFNQDLAAMPNNAGFNVLMRQPSGTQYVHEATAGNITGNYTLISHPDLDGRWGAVFQVTQNWRPNDVYNDKVIGVFYHEIEQRWAIFNQDVTNMPVGAAFNISID